MVPLQTSILPLFLALASFLYKSALLDGKGGESSQSQVKLSSAKTWRHRHGPHPKVAKKARMETYTYLSLGLERIELDREKKDCGQGGTGRLKFDPDRRSSSIDYQLDAAQFSMRFSMRYDG